MLILIVGGGIAGLTLAAALHQQGSMAGGVIGLVEDGDITEVSIWL